ncbi:hypothetical protein [Paenibacillus marinisediminis]
MKNKDLSLIIIFTTIILRYTIGLPDFIYGLGLGSGGALTFVKLYEFRNHKKQGHEKRA